MMNKKYTLALSVLIIIPCYIYASDPSTYAAHLAYMLAQKYADLTLQKQHQNKLNKLPKKPSPNMFDNKNKQINTTITNKKTVIAPAMPTYSEDDDYDFKDESFKGNRYRIPYNLQFYTNDESNNDTYNSLNDYIDEYNLYDYEPVVERQPVVHTYDTDEDY